MNAEAVLKKAEAWRLSSRLLMHAKEKAIESLLLFAALTSVAIIKMRRTTECNLPAPCACRTKFPSNAFYTYSKTLSSVQLHNNTTQGLAQNYTRLNLDKGRADTDQRHVFSMSLNYRPDYYTGGNPIVRGILNGWSISPVIKLRSGLPFTITNGNVDANLDGNTNDRARLSRRPTPRQSNGGAFVQHSGLRPKCGCDWCGD